MICFVVLILIILSGLYVLVMKDIDLKHVIFFQTIWSSEGCVYLDHSISYRYLGLDLAAPLLDLKELDLVVHSTVKLLS